MAIKTFKPTTPSRRHMTVSGFDGIDKKAKPEASLTEVLKKHAGRNSYGHITVRHHGGGNKRKYRIIDFKRQKLDMPATVERLEYDPNRSAFIALIKYEDDTLSYILAPNGLKAGDKVISSAAFYKNHSFSVKTIDFHRFIGSHNNTFGSGNIFRRQGIFNTGRSIGFHF